MTDDLRTISERLLAARELQPERFDAFKNKVFILLERIYPGQGIRFEDCVKPKSMAVFKDIVAYFVIDTPYNKLGGNLEFDEDMLGVHRTHLYRHVVGHRYAIADSDYRPMV